MFTGSVQASDRYIWTGSAIRAPNGNATVAEVGATRASKPCLPQPVEVALDQRPDLLGLEVERVVVARRQRVRAEHDPALDLGAEALAPGREVVREVVAAAADAVAEADAVVAGEVGRRLGRRDDVVRGEAVVGVREADLLDRRAGRLERGDGLADARLDARLHARQEVLLRQPEPLARAATRPPRRPRPAGRTRSSGTSTGARGGVALVAAGDRVQQRRGVASVARERPDLVEAARERHDPVPADPAVGRLEARRRRTAPPAGGSSRRCRCRCASGAWNAATAAAEPPDEPPGHPVEVPRVGGRPERRVLGRRAHRELVHVGLAQDHGPGVAQALRDVGVVRRAGSPRGSASRRCLAAARPRRGP